MPKREFEDGSTLEHAGRDSLKYTEGDCFTYIFWDYRGISKERATLPSSTMVIVSTDIRRWDEYPDGISAVIDDDKRREIVSKIKSVYNDCREETPEEAEERQRRKVEEFGEKVLQVKPHIYKKEFEDGSVIQKDKRLYRLKYIEGEYSFSIKYEQKLRFFSNKIDIVIDTQTLESWSTRPEGSSEFIDDDKKREILEKVMLYYRTLFSPKFVVKLDQEKDYFPKLRKETREEKMERDRQREEEHRKLMQTALVLKSEKVFDDGSVVDYFNRFGTMIYTKGEYSATVKVLNKFRFFGDPYCIIKSSSVKKWKTRPDGIPIMIDERNRQEIVGKIKAYYLYKYGIECIVK